VTAKSSDSMPTPPTIAIIGGGFSGAATAYHLADRIAAAGGRLVVYEPRGRLGAGLAYDTRNPVHRINVPADKMHLVPDDEGHFLRWLESRKALEDDPEARLSDGRMFPRRGTFGDYVESNLRPLVRRGLIQHRRKRATSVARVGARWRVKDDGGDWLDADVVVVATTHPSPSLPPVFTPLRDDKRLIANPAALDCLADLSGDERVLIIGAGLTMADVAASLHARRHRGAILAISRHGLRSKGHAESPVEPFGDFVSPPERSALSLLRRVRGAVRAAEASGISWHATFDALRKQGRDIWTALPVAERRKLVVRLRAYWDAHRFRVAPTVEKALDALMAEDRLQIIAATLEGAQAHEHGVAVSYRRRGARFSQQDSFDRVIITTGPSHRDIFAWQPALAEMNAAGLLVLDPVGLGLWCDMHGRALNHHGDPVQALYVAGPLARGAFGELMGLAEIAEFTVFLADEIAQTLNLRIVRERLRVSVA
jgi:uncharacterized NAD(P)/FAD-binding protein YdhS